MSKANEPAFPGRAIHRSSDGEFMYDTSFHGLTKREYFAAMAMQGIIAGYNSCVPGRTDTATMSLQFADALIRELEENKK